MEKVVFVREGTVSSEIKKQHPELYFGYIVEEYEGREDCSKHGSAYFPLYTKIKDMNGNYYLHCECPYNRQRQIDFLKYSELEDKVNDEMYYKKSKIANLQVEINTLKKEIKTMKSNVEETLKKVNELNEMEDYVQKL